MKLISTDMGQVLQLIVMEEVRPLSGLYLPRLLHAIWERYEFVSGPKDFEADIANGAKFKTGHLQIEGRDIAIQELGFYNDGVVVNALTTDDADLVTDNMLEWITREFKLRPIQTHKQRRHSSGLIVELDASVDTALTKFSTVAQIFSTALKAAYGVSYDYNVNTISFAVDPTVAPRLFNTKFQIERRVEIPFSANRYISHAPLKTDAHVRVLEYIERILASGG